MNEFMSEDVETIDSSRMRVLGEFELEYENDELITKPDAAARVKLFIGESGGDVIVASLSRNTGETRGDLALGKENILFAAESIELLLERETPWEEAIRRKSGRDELLIYFSSSWPHNLPAAFERVNLENKRKYKLDGLRSQVLGLSLPPRMARRLAFEIKRIFAGAEER